MNTLQWMGAVRMRVQTADKNITIIHSTPVQQVTCEEKNCMSERNKSIIKAFLTAYKASIHDIAFSSKKSSWLNQERNMHRSNTVNKLKQS